jgi:predicted nucleotidyltransferase
VVVLAGGMKKPLTWRGGRVSVLVGVRTRSARLSKEELLVHGTSILASMSTDLSRYDDVLALLAALPHEVPALEVVVVNGSAVTGGWDEHSDLDVEAWCSGDASAAYDAVLGVVRERLDVDHVWELPLATWPRGRQCFVHLQPDAADLSRPTRLLDVVVQTTPDRLTMDTRRHGVPMVLHDPDGLLVLEDDDEEAMAAERHQAVVQTAARRQTAAWLVARAIARDDLAEATALHMRLAVEPLVRLLRVRHCPARHDFGLRYLRTDLPPGLAERVEALLPGPDLAARSRAAFAWQDEVLRELTSRTTA